MKKIVKMSEEEGTDCGTLETLEIPTKKSADSHSGSQDTYLQEFDYREDMLPHARASRPDTPIITVVSSCGGGLL
jgi:hypothetical protein